MSHENIFPRACPHAPSRGHRPTPADYEAARRLHQKHGTSYYFATKLFPVEMQKATFALYAFFRVPDEFVDNGQSPAQAQRDLEKWQRDWERAYQQGDAEHPVLRVTAHTFHHYQIPYHYSESFLEAMFRDLTDTEYATYADLERYMYGSAACVGLMMTHVIGFSDPTALGYAEKLGYAMQMTNFLRDVDEDYQERGRIYLPQAELAQFGVTPEQIASRRFDANFHALMQFQMARTHALYDEANSGIPLLARDGRRAVRVASVLYRAILSKLAAQDSNPFAGRARTSTWEKLQRTAGVWFE
jgi:phytoene synthase